MKKTVVCIVALFLMLRISAQKVYTLEECIEIALKNSLLTQQSALAMQDAGTDVIQARHDKYPNVDFSAGHGLNFGRSIDPSTNDFINEQITRGGYFGGASIPLWQAGRFNHTVKRFQFAEEAARWSMKNEQDNLRLQVILAYLQVLSNQEMTNRLRIQEALTSQQLERIIDLDKNGAALPSQLADMRGQLATDQLSILDAAQQVNNAKLILSQLMNVTYDINMQIAADRDAAQIINSSPESSVLRDAMNKHPLIRASEFNTQSAESFIQSLRARRYPLISLGANMGTNYSSAYFVQGQKVPYFRQLSNNFNYAVGLSLYVPILNNYQLRSGLKKAETQLQRFKNTLDQSKNTIQQRFEEALLLQSNSIQRYRVLEGQIEAFKESFRIAEVRFNQGVIHSVEYLIVKNNLDRAENQLIATKYELAFRNKVIDFYNSLN